MRNRKRNRLKAYDYSRDNLYFVTICVDQMKCCLGEVQDSNAERTARELYVRMRESGKLNAFPKSSQKIMNLNAYGKIVEERLQWLQEQYQYVVLHNFVVMPNHVHAIIEIDRHKIPDLGIKIKSLSELVGAFKTISSKLVHAANLSSFKWKRSFHDHIIKDDRAYVMISNYIKENPNKWGKDVFNQ